LFVPAIKIHMVPKCLGTVVSWYRSVFLPCSCHCTCVCLLCDRDHSDNTTFICRLFQHSST